jgi:hypothetical protein
MQAGVKPHGRAGSRAVMEKKVPDGFPQTRRAEH